MTGKQKKMLARIAVSLFLFIALLIAGKIWEIPWGWGVALMALPYLLAGYDVLFDAFKKLFTGQMFDEKLLMTVASLGAFVLCLIDASAHSAHEGAAVMIFYQVGELFQSIAVGRSRSSVKKLLDMMPQTACVERPGGEETVDPLEVKVGEIFVVRPGERIPLDGEIVGGGSALDTSPLTGESLPREAAVGDSVLSGCIVLEGMLRVRASRPFEESTVSKIMELVENAGANKTSGERFISSFARVYTPLVTVAALLLALVPSLFVGFSSGDWTFVHTFRPYVHAGLMFLIVSCPCALVISVPLGFFAAIGAAGKRGILFKGSLFLEKLSKTKVVLFDKTGTLTSGQFKVDRVCAVNGGEDDLLRLAAAVERGSLHPLARAVCAAADGSVPDALDVREVPGMGAVGRVNGEEIFVGSHRLMETANAAPSDLASGAGSAVHVARRGAYLGCITFVDTFKPDSADAIDKLKAMGVRTVMLTGDRRSEGERAAAALGMDGVEAELLPQNKVEIAKRFMNEKQKDETVAFVGDGINDAPVLATVDVGAAMGALGSDAAVEAADVVLAGDRPSDLAVAVKISKKAMRLSRENIIFALTVKAAILVLLALMAFLPALSGLNAYAGEFAVFADVGVSVIAILNAMRAGR
ncbi:MAG: heavy metal translocating P-type ATPase [Clostridia bacterium]|nr:heavy metal translocating P-type ATPase [Clostridia bacterium]